MLVYQASERGRQTATLICFVSESHAAMNVILEKKKKQNREEKKALQTRFTFFYDARIKFQNDYGNIW